MKVRMKTTARGPDFSADAGNVVEVSEDRALQLVEAGAAEFEEEPVRQAPPLVETATVDSQVETAEAPEGRRGRKGRW